MNPFRPRELIETAVFLAAWYAFHRAHVGGWQPVPILVWASVAWCAGKFCYFLAENGRHIVEATSRDVPYHQFLIFMAWNICQMAFSFALDFQLLQTMDPSGLNSVSPELTGGGLLFECFFFSMLNFSFFGFGDITPATVPLKLVTLLEVVLALLTVIFILGDFISIKDSVRRAAKGGKTSENP
jgi:hypothetical protein